MGLTPKLKKIEEPDVDMLGVRICESELRREACACLWVVQYVEVEAARRRGLFTLTPM